MGRSRRHGGTSMNRTGLYRKHFYFYFYKNTFYCSLLEGRASKCQANNNKIRNPSSLFGLHCFFAARHRTGVCGRLVQATDGNTSEQHGTFFFFCYTYAAELFWPPRPLSILAASAWHARRLRLKKGRRASGCRHHSKKRRTWGHRNTANTLGLGVQCRTSCCPRAATGN